MLKIAEVSRAPVTKLVKNTGAKSESENAIDLHEPLHSVDSVFHHITFPFVWRHGETLIAKIEKLSEDELSEIVEKTNGSEDKPICTLCGEQKELEYQKKSGNVSHLICGDCAIRYVRKTLELKNRN